jgi:hypothetical protein
LDKELKLKDKKLRDLLVRNLDLIKNSKNIDKGIYYFEELYRLNKNLNENKDKLIRTLINLLKLLRKKGDWEKVNYYQSELDRLKGKG